MNLKFDASQSLIEPHETQRTIEDHRAHIEQLVTQKPQPRTDDARWLGWFSVEKSATPYQVQQLLDEAARARTMAKTMIVIGIGGSNRGAMAAISALQPHIQSTGQMQLVWAGDTLSSAALTAVLERVRTEDVVVAVIAKDFRTLEPGVAFRMIRTALMQKYGSRYAERIIAIGSHGESQLYQLAQSHGYRFLSSLRILVGAFRCSRMWGFSYGGGRGRYRSAC